MPEQPALLADMPEQQLLDRTHQAELRMFESHGNDLSWFQVFSDLVRDEGWYWRDAAYIAWKSLPKKIRVPRTQVEFAALIQCGVTTINQRRENNPNIDARVNANLLKRMAGDIGDVVDAMMEVATKADYKAHNDRKLALEIAGIYKNEQNLNLTAKTDMSEKSDEELERMAGLGDGGAGAQ